MPLITALLLVVLPAIVYLSWRQKASNDFEKIINAYKDFLVEQFELHRIEMSGATSAEYAMRLVKERQLIIKGRWKKAEDDIRAIYKKRYLSISEQTAWQMADLTHRTDTLLSRLEKRTKAHFEDKAE